MAEVPDAGSTEIHRFIAREDRGVEQTKERRWSVGDLGEQLNEGLGQALAYLDGEEVPGVRLRAITAIPDKIDVATIRTRLGMKRKHFAGHFGFQIGTLTKWVRGERPPDGAARTLLLATTIAEAFAGHSSCPTPRRPLVYSLGSIGSLSSARTAKT